jgi:hypothetical protein
MERIEILDPKKVPDVRENGLGMDNAIIMYYTYVLSDRYMYR